MYVASYCQMFMIVLLFPMSSVEKKKKQIPCHKSMSTMEKLHVLKFELLLHPHLIPSDYHLFKNRKRILQGNKFILNGKIISKARSYFERLNEAFKCVRLSGWTIFIAPGQWEKLY